MNESVYKADDVGESFSICEMVLLVLNKCLRKVKVN